MRSLHLLAMLSATACSKWVPMAIPAPQTAASGKESTTVQRWNRVRLNLHGGQVLVLHDAALVGDSIRGAPESEPSDSAARLVSIPSRAVTRFELRRTDPLRTGLFIGVLGGLVALAAALESMSWDGTVRIPCGLLGEPCPSR